MEQAYAEAALASQRAFMGLTNKTSPAPVQRDGPTHRDGAVDLATLPTNNDASRRCHVQ